MPSLNSVLPPPLLELDLSSMYAGLSETYGSRSWRKSKFKLKNCKMAKNENLCFREAHLLFFFLNHIYGKIIPSIHSFIHTFNKLWVNFDYVPSPCPCSFTYLFLKPAEIKSLFYELKWWIYWCQLLCNYDFLISKHQSSFSLFTSRLLHGIWSVFWIFSSHFSN